MAVSKKPERNRFTWYDGDVTIVKDGAGAIRKMTLKSPSTARSAEDQALPGGVPGTGKKRP